MLVRHAKAGDRELWSEPDELRPLTTSGRRQAEGLVPLLADMHITAVLSSPSVRCRQTVEPLAQARGLVVRDDDALAEGTGAEPTLRLIESLDDAVLCSHADVIASVMLELADRSVRLPGDLLWEKGSTWVLEMRDGSAVKGRYLPPP